VRSKKEQIPFSFSLVANSNAVVTMATQGYWYVSTGIAGRINSLLGDVIYHSTKMVNCDGVPTDQTYFNFGILDSSGAMHPVTTGTVDTGVMVNGQLVHCDLTNVSGGANDNSGLSMQWGMTVTPTVYDAHGNNVNLQTGTLTDKDGNTMSHVSTGSTSYKIVDSEGATVLTVSLQGAGNGTKDTYSYTDFNGKTQNFVVTYGAYTEYTQFGCGGTDIHGVANQYFLPHTITIPKMNGDSAAGVYTLGYEPTAGGTSGRLASITYPTGGQMTYSYQTNGSAPINCNDKFDCAYINSHNYRHYFWGTR
jgi:hypothetical protein